MIGSEIKNIRIAHGITQKKLSDATGIPQNTISWIESNRGIPNVQQCISLADYYGISLDELVGRDIKNDCMKV